jgi:hypothetical protein
MEFDILPFSRETMMCNSFPPLISIYLYVIFKFEQCVLTMIYETFSSNRICIVKLWLKIIRLTLKSIITTKTQNLCTYSGFDAMYEIWDEEILPIYRACRYNKYRVGINHGIINQRARGSWRDRYWPWLLPRDLWLVVRIFHAHIQVWIPVQVRISILMLIYQSLWLLLWTFTGDSSYSTCKGRQIKHETWWGWTVYPNQSGVVAEMTLRDLI